MTDSLILSAENLTKCYHTGEGVVKALNGISLALEAGDFVAVHGPSGCGKSTLLLIAGGLLSPDEGRLRIAGVEPYALSPGGRSAFRADHVGFVFQQFHLIPYLDVLDNLLVNELTPGDRRDLRGAAEELLERFQLGERKHHVPSQLSVGEQQRVALARALLRRPRLVLADEPTGNLDAGNSRILLGCLEEYSAGGGAVLMVTHDDRAREAAARSIEMKAGEIVAPA